MKKLTIMLLVMLITSVGLGAIGGTGTSSDPWTIPTAADWKTYAGTSTYWNATTDYAVITADLDFAGGSVTNLAGDTAASFQGQLDGQGFIIRDILLDVPSTITDVRSTGLIGHLGTGALIKNIVIVDAVLTGTELGSLTGATGYSFNGVICGQMSTNTTIQNCTVINCDMSLVLTTAVNTIGLIGPITGSGNGTITDCQVIGGVVRGDNIGSTNIVKIGGLVGVIPAESNPGVLKDCTSTATLTHVTAGASDEVVNIGGLVGSVSPSAANAIARCIWIGSINYAKGAETLYVGGLVGQAASTNLEDCSALGTFNLTTNGTQGVYVGGMLGNTPSGGSTVSSLTRCSSDITTMITYNNGFQNVYFGGACGYDYGGAFTDCYAKGAVYDLTQADITDTDFFRSGGFIGVSNQNVGPEPDVQPVYTRCYTQVQNSAGYSLGGFVYSVSSTATFLECLWDSDNVGTDSDDSHVGTTGYAYTEMIARTTYSGWPLSTTNNSSTWKMVVGKYPILSWQTYPLENDEDDFGVSNTAHSDYSSTKGQYN